MHHLPLDVIVEHCNPFDGCWRDIDRPIEMTEVQHCLFMGEEALTDTPLSFNKMPPSDARERHVRKIAWFVRYSFNEPISLDVGIPSMGVFPNHLVDDGNHRLASAIYRWDVLHEREMVVPAQIAGDIGYAQELGLWAPDEDERASYEACSTT